MSMFKRRGDAASPMVAPKEPRHGRDETAAWIQALALEAVPRWHVEVSLDGGAGTRFHLNIYAEEWGFAFHHARRSSWIRITDIPFVHGRDDFNLLARTPDLRELGAFVAELETAHRIEFARRAATVRSNVVRATGAVRKWLVESTDRDRCGDEMHRGIRCTRPKGHDGHHAFENHHGVLRWYPAS